MNRYLTSAAIIIALLGGTALAQNTSAPRGSIEAAQRFMEVSGQNEEFAYYTNLFVPALIRNFRAEHHDVSDACLKTREIALRKIMLKAGDAVGKITAEAYAEYFNDEELGELANFFSSDLGKQYSSTSRKLVAKAVRNPETAKAFFQGVNAELSSHDANHSEKIIAASLQGLHRVILEQDVTRLSNFFYNGVGRKYLELSPVLAQKAGEFEQTMMISSRTEMLARLNESENCK